MDRGPEEMMDPDAPGPVSPVELAALTSQIVSAFVGQHKLGATELPDIIATVHTALATLGRDTTPATEKPVPLMPIKKTINDAYLVSLEDGRHYKSLKRHLSGRGLTPATYREKWGLPKDYPMVAPSYARRRSELARALGLGQQRRTREPAEAAASEPARGRARQTPQS